MAFNKTGKLIKYLNEEKQSFINFIRLFIPKGKKENLIFYLSLIFYFLLGLYLLFTTSIIDSKRWNVDAYWGFDNMAVFLTGYTNIPRHPLLVVFTKPLIVIGNFLAASVSYKLKGVLFVLFCNICVSLSVVYIYRYIKQIVRINKISTRLLILFIMFNPVFVMLSFTSDTFTFSLPLLCFALFYYSDLIDRGIKSPFMPQLFLVTVTGGITITNMAKVIIPSLFTKTTIKVHIRNLLVIGFLFFMMMVAVELKYGIIWSLVSALESAKYEYNRTENLQQIIEGFFGVSLLLPELTTLQQRLELDIVEFPFYAKSIIPDCYNSILYYASLTIFYVIILLSLLKNIKNKHVIILALVFGWNILIHIVCKFVIHQLHLYAGHWVYIFPLILAWGWKRLSEKQVQICNVLFLIFILGTMINNVWRFMEFIALAQRLHPPVI